MRMIARNKMLLLPVCLLLAVPCLQAQSQQRASAPIAVVPLEGKSAEAAPKVSGALEVTAGRAVIVTSGSVTAGSATAHVTLPHRGQLKVCASTTVKLAADSSSGHDEVPGLLMALDRGAIEMSYATGRSADIVMTPDFRILISGPGAADVKLRLGEHGDTCIDNAGTASPYVLVTSVFDGGNYRVQSGQRVMFQHGSLHEVVDHEKESCGCPPPSAKGNEFPLAQSEGLAPLATSAQPAPGEPTVSFNEPMVYHAGDREKRSAGAAPQQAQKTPDAEAPKPASESVKQPKPGFFGSIGRFFRRIFGAESEAETAH